MRALHARTVPDVLDASIALLMRWPLLLGGLAWHCALPVAACVFAALGLIHVRPQWANAGALPVLAGAAAWFLLRRGVTAGAVALAVEDLAAGRTPETAKRYLDRARSLSHRLVPSSAAAAVLLILAPVFGGLTPLIAPTWLLIAAPLAVTDAGRAGSGRWRQGGRAIHLLALLVLAWIWFTVNLAVGPMIAVYLAEHLLAIDLTWWGRLVSPTHALYLELSLVGGWLLMEPIAQVAGALFSLDLRVRREGLDLKRMIGAAATVAAMVLMPAVGLAAPAEPEQVEGEQEQVEEQGRTERVSMDAQAAGEAAERVANAMQRVFARPEFAELPSGTGDDTISGWLERFWHWLASLFEGREPTRRQGGCAGGNPGSSADGDGWGSILTLLAAGLGLTALALALRRLLAGPASEVETRAEPTAPEALTRTPSDWLAEADRLAAQGRLREALRHSFLALLGGLHRARVIDYDESRTNGEYLVDLRRRRPEVRPPYRELSALFDRAWYGAKPVTNEDWQRGRAAAGRALAAAKGPE